MAYIFKQKINLADLVGLTRESKRVLIYEPQNDLAALYAHYLKVHNFDIKHCLHLPAIRQLMLEFKPHLLIFNAEQPHVLSEIKRTTQRLGSDYIVPSLISTGYNLSGQEIGELMSYGVSSHINRKLSRPEDLAILVEAILK
jgi:hypothetical protein